MALDLDARNGDSPDATVHHTGSSDGLQGSEIHGLDALRIGFSTPPLAHAAWRVTWPKLAALAIALGLWQLVVLSGWRPSYVLPGPAPVFVELGHRFVTQGFWQAVGVLVAGSLLLRAAIGSLIAGLQTTSSIAWFPLAILLFQMPEQAILFVILIGAVPSIANGVISGVDYVPALLVRAGRNVGGNGLSLCRHVVLPVALPSIMAGLKEGWAFACRSLLAGELRVSIASRPSLGQYLNQSRQLGDTSYMIALMIVLGGWHRSRRGLPTRRAWHPSR